MNPNRTKRAAMGQAPMMTRTNSTVSADMSCCRMMLLRLPWPLATLVIFRVVVVADGFSVVIGVAPLVADLSTPNEDESQH